MDDVRLCACGCGRPVKGWNSRTQQPIQWRPGHAGRGRPRQTARQKAQRDRWPSREEAEEMLREHGTISGVARALDRPVATVRHILKTLGVDLGVPHANAMPRSTTKLGWEGEDHAALVLGAAVVRTQGGDDPYDLTWHGLRVEVKTARPTWASDPRALGWTFSIAHNAGKHDALFCICCAENGLPRAYFLIPADAAPAKMLRIPLSLRSKWARYEWRPTSGTFPL